MLALSWWLTGLPGAGKTTLAQALAQALRRDGRPTCVLDGDEVRQGLCQDLDFSPAARHENMRRVAEMARIINANGIHVVVAMVSPTLAGRAAAQHIIGPERFLEVHVATPLSVCQTRDPKGLYARARSGQDLGLTGVQSGFETPPHADLVLDTSTLPLAAALAQLLELPNQRFGPLLLPPPFSLREVNESDEAFLKALYAASREDLIPPGVPAAALASLFEMQRQIHQAGMERQFPHARHRMVLRHEQPIGRLVLAQSAADLRLVDLAIAPAARRQGAAKAVVRAVQARAQNSGLPVTLAVSRANPAACALYAGLGFSLASQDDVWAQLSWRGTAP